MHAAPAYNVNKLNVASTAFNDLRSQNRFTTSSDIGSMFSNWNASMFGDSMCFKPTICTLVQRLDSLAIAPQFS